MSYRTHIMSAVSAGTLAIVLATSATAEGSNRYFTPETSIPPAPSLITPPGQNALVPSLFWNRVTGPILFFETLLRGRRGLVR